MSFENSNFHKLILTMTCIMYFIHLSKEHGRLIDPPGRSTAWRYGFKTEVNYNDNELFCGGYTTQHSINKGKCGICGDPYNGERKNELPNGIYARRLVITRSYNESNTILAKVQLTANHRGYFVFKVCPAVTLSEEVSQNCLDNNVLEVINSHEKFKYIVPNQATQVFSVILKLPNGLICERCVMQWTYTAGNNWGKCEDGKSAVGCGPQETFRACADIKINKNEAPLDSTTLSSENEIMYETTTSKYKFTQTLANLTSTLMPTSTSASTSISTSPSTTSTSTSTLTSSSLSTSLSTLFSTSASTSSSSSTSTLTSTLPSTSTSNSTSLSNSIWSSFWTSTSTSTLTSILNLKSTLSSTPASINNMTSLSESTTTKKYFSKPSYSTRSWIKPFTVSKVNSVSKNLNIVDNHINHYKNKNCVGAGFYRKLPGIENWCDINCAAGFCPPSHCKCYFK